MHQHQLSNTQQNLLKKLLSRFESGQTERIISIRVTPERFEDYFKEDDPTRVKRWKEEILELVALDYIYVDYGKRASSHQIERIRFNTKCAPQLNQILGLITLHELRKELRDMLKNISENTSIETHPQWWFDFLNQEKLELENFNSALERRKEFLEEQRFFYKTMEGIAKHSVQFVKLNLKMNWRQFSVKYFGDSKKLNSSKNKILRTLVQFALKEETLGEIQNEAALFSYVGIEFKEEIFLICGPAKLRSQDLREWRPFFALSETMSHEVWDLSLVKGILTIENEESFHFFSRQNLKPEWLALYLGGFPSSSKMNLLKKWSTLTSAPFYHWGDLDCGGIEIFLFLEKELGLKIRPLGMSGEVLERYLNSTQTLSSIERKKLEKLKSKIEKCALSQAHALSPLIDKMLAMDKKLEQEAVLDPMNT